MDSTPKSPSAWNRLGSFAQTHKNEYIRSMVVAVLGVACGMIPYYAVSHIVVALIERTKDASLYLYWAGIAALGYVAKEALHSISTAISHRATFAVISHVRNLVAEKLIRVPMGYTLDTPSGMIKNIMVEKVDSIEPTLAHVLPEMTSNLLVPLFILAYIAVLDWRMAFMAVLTLPIGFVCYMGMMKDYEAKFQRYMDVFKEMNATVVEYINGIEVIKAFGQAENSYRKYFDTVHSTVEYALEWMRGVQVYFAMGMGIWPAVLVGILPVGCFLMLRGTLEASAFVTITILSLGVVGPLLAVVYSTDDVAKIGSIVGDIGKILDEPEQVRPTEAVELSGRNIDIREVTFAYGDVEVLHNISLSIPEGSVTALVGPSGGGKSTIAKLVASLWDVRSGSIKVGSVDVRAIPHYQLMEVLCYVSQDNYLFNESVMDNIRLGKPSASDEEVMRVAKLSGCHDFIMHLEQGYHTVVGDAGNHLSGGERQRIAIARAMMKNADIIILDEATAYTDPESEAVMQQAVAKLIEGKTLIVIAHRLSTITNSDTIVVVEDGRILASGTHEHLLADCSLYAQMWDAHVSAKDVF